MLDKAKNCLVVPRLLALLGAGYVVRVRDSVENGNCISLEHPSPWKRVREKEVFLYEDGSVFGVRQHEDRTHLLINAEDDEAFNRLVASTPRPTWWDLNCGPFYAVAAWALVLGTLLVGVAAMDWVWGLLTRG